MLTLKNEAKRFLASVLTVITMFSCLAGVAYADEVDIPDVQNTPTLNLKGYNRDGSVPVTDTGSMNPKRTDMFSTLAPTLVMLDDNDCDMHSGENIENVAFNVEYDNKQYSFDSPYEYVSGFDTLVVRFGSEVNYDGACSKDFANFLGILSSGSNNVVVPKTVNSYVGSGSRVVYFINYLYADEIYRNLNKCDFTMEITYFDGFVQNIPVGIHWGDSVDVHTIVGTSSGVVLRLADAKTISNFDFYKLENAISYAVAPDGGNNKYYVDINSKDKVVLPIEGMSDDMDLTQVRIGNDIVYNTASSVDFNRDGFESEYDGRVFSFVGNSYASELDMRNMFAYLMTEGNCLVELDGKMYQAAAITPDGYSFADIANDYPADYFGSYNPIWYEPKYKVGTNSESVARAELSALERGHMVDVGVTGIPGTEFDISKVQANRPSDLGSCVVDMVFDTTESSNTHWISTVVPASGWNTYDNNRVYSFLKAIPFVRFYVIDTEGNEVVYDDIDAIRNDDLTGCKLARMSFTDATLGSPHEFGGLSVINYIRDYHTSSGYRDAETGEWVYTRHNFCVIDADKSSMPDFSNCTISSETIWDHLSVSEFKGMALEVVVGSDEDTVLARHGDISATASKNTDASRTDTYKDGAIRIETSDVPSAEKGETYDVINQVQWNANVSSKEYSVGTGGVYHDSESVYATDENGYRITEVFVDDDGKEYNRYVLADVIELDDIIIKPMVYFANGDAIVTANMFDRDVYTSSWYYSYANGIPQGYYDKYQYDSAPFAYTEYKWGELVFASKPDPVENLSFDAESNKLTWSRPLDQGLGVNSDKTTRSDDVIYVQSYTINVYDDNDKKIRSVTLESDGNESQFYALDDLIEENKAYKIEVIDANAIGTAKNSINVKKVKKIPSIEITMTPDQPAYNINDTVVYTEVVENTGNVKLTGVAVSQDAIGKYQGKDGLKAKGTSAVIPDLDVGEKFEFIYKVPANEAVENKLINSVEVTTKEGASDEASCTVYVYDPNISVTKVSDKDVYREGDAIIYSDTVTNTGDITLTNIKVTEYTDGEYKANDRIRSNGNEAVIDKLEPGESIILVYNCSSNDISHDDIDVTSYTSVEASEGPKAEANTVFKIVKLDLSVDTFADKAYYTKDESMIFTDTVTNTGNYVLKNVLVTESIPGGSLEVGGKVINSNVHVIEELRPNESVVLRYTVPVEKAEITDDTVVSFVTAVSDDISARADRSIPIVVYSISVEKAADKESCYLNDTVKFTDTITNMGNYRLTNVVVNESLNGTYDIDYDGFILVPQGLLIPVLEPGDSFVINHIVTADKSKIEGNVITDTVGVASSEGAMANASASVNVLEPSVTIKKTTDKDAYFESETVTYTNTITNTCDSALTNVVVTEDLKGTYSNVDDDLIIAPTQISIPVLNAGESFVYSYDVVISDVKHDSKLDSTVTVISSEGASAKDSKSVNIEADKIANVSVEKVPEKDSYDLNSTSEIVFTDTITNTGNVNLTNVVVTEDLNGHFAESTDNSTVIENLAVGESVVLKFIVSVNDVSHDNNTLKSVVTVSSNEGANGEAKAVVNIYKSVIDVVVTKTSDKNSYNKGDVMAFTDIVKNTGDVVLHNVVVTENLDGKFDSYDGISFDNNKAVIKELKPGEFIGLIYRVPTDNIETNDGINYIDSIVNVDSDEGAKHTAKLTVTIIDEVETPDVPAKDTPDVPETKPETPKNDNPKTNTSETPKESVSKQSTPVASSTSDSSVSNPVKTGDTRNVTLIILMFAVSGVCALVFYKKKKD